MASQRRNLGFVCCTGRATTDRPLCTPCKTSHVWEPEHERHAGAVRLSSQIGEAFCKLDRNGDAIAFFKNLDDNGYDARRTALPLDALEGRRPPGRQGG